ncbi:MAG: MotA/TolQ/ExbB proton channel family protein [Gemmataceae bacterium]
MILARSSRLTLAAFALAASLVCFLPSLAWAQDAAAAPAASSVSGNKFIFIIASVGWLFGLILLGVAMWMVALVVLLSLDLRMAGAIPNGFVDEFADQVNKRNFKGAFDMAKADPSFLGRVLTAGMSRLQYGLEDAREAAANSLESLKADKDQKNNYLAVIATLGPLLGLVGTVFGMIGAFMTLSEESQASNATKLAGDIAHALSVTLIGVAISCPSIAFNTFFRNRISRVMLDVGHIADDLLTQMYHNSKKGASAAVAPVAAPPATKS